MKCLEAGSIKPVHIHISLMSSALSHSLSLSLYFSSRRLYHARVQHNLALAALRCAQKLC